LTGHAAEFREDESIALAPIKSSIPLTLADLPAPQLISPADGEIFGQSTIDTEPVLFEWNAVNDAEGYELMLTTPSRTVPIYIRVTGTSFQLWLNSASGIPGETDGDYSWAVRTLDEDGDDDERGDFSAHWTFRIDTLYDGQPSLIAPLNGESFEKGTVSLEWQVPSDISGTQYTVVQVFNSSILAPENLTHEETVFAPRLNLTFASLETGTYFWRCQAFDIAGNPCDWSPVWNFSVDIIVPEMPPMPAPIAPPVTTLEMGTHYVDESGTVYVTSMTEFNLIASGESTSDITTSYCIDEGPWLEFDTPFYISGQNGVRNISFYSSDEFGNNEDSQRIQVVLTSVNLKSWIFKCRWFTERIMFNVILENNWPLEITQLEMNLDIPEDFRIRHISVWLKESERWPRPLFLFLSSSGIFGGPRAYNFMDEMEITYEDNKLNVPSVPIGGKLLVFVSLKYAPEGEISDSAEEFLPLEYTFGASAVLNATSSYDPDQGLFDVCSTQEAIELIPSDYHDRFHSFQSDL
jgi:hypothetical protein